MSSENPACRGIAERAGRTVRRRGASAGRRHVSRGLVAAIAVGALAVAAPPAAASWSPPQTLSDPHTFLIFGAIGFTARGGTVVSWSRQDGIGDDGAHGVSMVSRASATAAFGPERALPADVVAGPLTYGSGRVLIARLAERRISRRVLLQTLSVQIGDLEGRFGRAQIVARARTINARSFLVRTPIVHVRLAGNARGDAALVWREDRGPGGRGRVHVSVRRAGRPFGHPIRLTQEHIRDVSVAVGAAGEVLVAWDGVGRIRCRYQGLVDGGFGALQTLRSQPAFSAAIQTAIGRDGRAWVAWTAPALSEGGTHGQVFVQAATRRRGARRRFGRAQLLEHAPTTATASPVSLAVDARGEAILGWALWDAGGGESGISAIRAAHARASGPPRIEDLARLVAGEPSATPLVAVADDGRAIVTWSESLDPLAATARLAASVQSPDGRWGPSDVIATGPSPPIALATAFSAGEGPPVVLLAARAPGARPEAVVQLTTRDGA